MNDKNSQTLSKNFDDELKLHQYYLPIPQHTIVTQKRGPFFIFQRAWTISVNDDP